MAGKFLRGAFIEFTETFLVPVPNVIIFQFNPEQIVHTWTPAKLATDEGDNQLAVGGDPSESFSFTLKMDAGDMLADGSPVAEGIAKATGIASRLAALEMLLHPTEPAGGSLLGAALLNAFGASAGADTEVPASQLPTVLFVWGPGRILPVRLSSLVVTETLYDPLLLNPTHAEAQVSLDVLTAKELQHVTGPLADLATTAHDLSRALRKGLAVVNLANSAEAAIGALPL